jgi:Flp pilus assembly protein protease CpaA
VGSLSTVELARWLSTAVLGGACITAELRTKHIPNWLTLGALPLVFLAALLLDRLDDFAVGFLVAGCLCVALFRRGFLAGGGVKTAALLGACGGGAAGLAIAAAFSVVWLISEIEERRGREERSAFPSTPIALVAALVGLGVRAAVIAS